MAELDFQQCMKKNLNRQPLLPFVTDFLAAQTDGQDLLAKHGQRLAKSGKMLASVYVEMAQRRAGPELRRTTANTSKELRQAEHSSTFDSANAAMDTSVEQHRHHRRHRHRHRRVRRRTVARSHKDLLVGLVLMAGLALIAGILWLINRSNWW